MNRTIFFGIAVIILIVSIATVAVVEIRSEPASLVRADGGARGPVYVGLVLLTGLFMAVVGIIIAYASFQGWNRLQGGRERGK